MAKIEGITNKFPIIPSIYFNTDNLHQLRLPAEERIPEPAVRIPAVAEGRPAQAAEDNSAEAPEHNPEEEPEADNPVAQLAAVLLPAS